MLIVDFNSVKLRKGIAFKSCWKQFYSPSIGSKYQYIRTQYIRTHLLSSNYYFLISFINSASENLKYYFIFNLKLFLKILILAISFLVFKYLKLLTFIEVDIYFT
jgi:hypothetical protein